MGVGDLTICDAAASCACWLDPQANTKPFATATLCIAPPICDIYEKRKREKIDWQREKKKITRKWWYCQAPKMFDRLQVCRAWYRQWQWELSGVIGASSVQRAVAVHDKHVSLAARHGQHSSTVALHNAQRTTRFGYKYEQNIKNADVCVCCCLLSPCANTPLLPLPHVNSVPLDYITCTRLYNYFFVRREYELIPTRRQGNQRRTPLL